MARKAATRIVKIGPFAKGLNNFSDPSAIPDDALTELVNMELDLDGSLVSRPPFENLNINMPLGAQGDMEFLGFYYTAAGAEYLIASDRVSSTYYLANGAWNLLTNTFAATAMTQFDDKAWLLAPVGSTNPGGTWTPTAGFVAEANMPKGTVIVAFKFRLWVAQGEQATTNGSRLYFSKLLGITPFWPASPEFVDIARGDGQSIVSIRRYYESLLIFRSESIYRYQYTTDPATGVIEVSVPNVGLDTRHSIVEHENFFYFVYDDRAYQYMNGRAHDISQAVRFLSGARTGYVRPRSVSLFRDRVLFSFYDTLYVFSLTTRTWSKWQMPSIGGIASIFQRRGDSFSALSAYAMSSVSQVPKDTQNLALNGAFEVADSLLPTVPKGLTAPASTKVELSTDWKFSGTSSAKVSGLVSGTTATYVDYVVQGLVIGRMYTVAVRQNVALVSGEPQSLSAAQMSLSGVLSSTVITAGSTAAGDRTVRSRFVASAATATIRLHCGAALGGGHVFWDDLTVVAGDVPALEPFSGATPAAGTLTYIWTGVAGDSISIQRDSKREAALYRITEEIGSASEPFECLVRTKIFNFEESSKYKRLFWWGIDAIFRQTVVGTVNPIAYGGQVTWGELLGTTWNKLLEGTWGQPTAKGLSVQTIRPDLGSTAMRKFAKFRKKLRFRQLQFELVFDTDGSSSTAPVRLFSIHNEVTQAQTVSKSIT